jgi:hypothetical protein
VALATKQFVVVALATRRFVVVALATRRYTTNLFDILNVAITWISWGAAPGYINIAPLGLFGSYLSYERFLKKSKFFHS